MRQLTRTILFLAATLLASSALVAGQATATEGPAKAGPYVVSGRVVDQTGAALPGVAIDVHIGSQEFEAVSDALGWYAINDVPAGRAELTYRLLNFSVARRTIDARAGATTIPDVVMTLALNADVLVTGTSTFRNIADVANPAENLVGIASAASQGAITAAQLEVRPVMRAGEVLETVPGMIVSQHSGEGKANQYYLRGFNLDHGTDFALTIAGVPINTPTGGHAHGYADSNFLIPELVSGIQFKKGPYFAEEGDFSAAGAASVNYVNELVIPVIHVSGGGNGWGRLFTGASRPASGGTWLAAAELNRNDGPWNISDDYRKLNGIVRYSRGNNRRGFTVTGQGSWADWHATDQIPDRAVTSGVLSRFDSVDSSDHGATNRQSLAAEFEATTARDSLRASAYVLRNSLNLFSNFTYFLADPVNGDQFEQAERRIAAGGRTTYRRLGHVFGRHTESAIGGQVRLDWLSPVGLYAAVGGQRRSTTREDTVNQALSSGYAQSEIEWSRHVRTTLGLRADVYNFNVTSNNTANSGSGSAGLVSPKFGAAIGPWRGTEFYANAGFGFHSNDARGTTTTIDPVTGEPAAHVTPLVRARGAEVGFRTVAIRGLQSTVALWYLGIDSELLFVGDAGTTEAGRPSRRTGIEWSSYARLTPWLTVDADLSFSQSRFTDDDRTGTRIPGALDRVIAAGVSFEPKQRLFGSLRVRHFGPRPLIEDASVASRSTTLWNGQTGVSLRPGMRLVADGFNLLNAKASDIDYFYTSRLRGEPADGVDDTHTHPAVPRTVRIALQLAF